LRSPRPPPSLVLSVPRRCRLTHVALISELTSDFVTISAPPNPREWAEDRFATAEQKLIAQYNIACCYAAMRDSGRAVDVLRAYLNQVSDPLNQVNEMLVDADLEPIRAELRELREEQKARGAPPGLFGLKGVTNPLRALADQVQVEWKD